MTHFEDELYVVNNAINRAIGRVEHAKHHMVAAMNACYSNGLDIGEEEIRESMQELYSAKEALETGLDLISSTFDFWLKQIGPGDKRGEKNAETTS